VAAKKATGKATKKAGGVSPTSLLTASEHGKALADPYGDGAGMGNGGNGSGNGGGAGAGAGAGSCSDWTTGYNAGLLNGNQIKNTIQIPVDISGNAIAVLGFASASSTGGAMAHSC
jgi:hypothetical protein